ncbi:putative transcriptional regulator of levanase operon, AAA-ATPase domain (NtrC family), fused to 2 BglG-like domains [Clostridium acetobutylicum EA 2018]|uniref:sigma 54-interacting transcriptional regulator n=1 Tax=Clostridium acetobutylicum TaxID=1488 RepID=UPI000200A6BB|nr:sigma-54-dependent transcriptional regulator [Clostridium acetobutylicum]ADZ19431.1 putative transcriptional regulator of levanase operon, AAA-ATPase domain (NtrC family), fused to 2 BglG-like domains [Clostridium acetobutylicum EA 2018]
MNRKEQIYNKLYEMPEGTKISAKELAEVLNMSRANVSHELNNLCKEGKIFKTNGRPVLFFISNTINTKIKKSKLDEFVKNNLSLRQAVEQLKAAILYPPNGMNCLILGNTGVGKSMFASLMHEYAVEMRVKEKGSPFITFNCADYSNNPQLLTSQLFGIKKGTYTGADSDRIGLIEKANGGILFLDEVHRLPPEGQEALFTFLDKGIFRRMGDDKSRSSNVLIISATTENPNSSLLKTFTRRIPMLITIPSLSERTLEERLYLVKTFFKDESKKLNRDISVSLNTVRAFLSYDCPNNIGQLKSDVQLVCARAYSEFLTGSIKDVRINSRLIPIYVKEGLFKEKEHRILWNKLMGDEIEYFKFSSNEAYDINEDSQNAKKSNIYEYIEQKLQALKHNGISNIDIENILEKDITKYFTKYISGISEELNKKNLITILGEDTLNFVDKIIYQIVTSLRKNINNNVYTALALHINTLITRINSNKTIINPELRKIKSLYPTEYKIALNAKKQIENYINHPIPDDEAGYIALFIVNNDEKSPSKVIDTVKIIIIAHGKSTATSMAEVANTLLEENFVIGINCPLDMKPSVVLGELKETVKSNLSTSGYILLVDMGSLTTFGEIIKKEFNIPVKVFPLVSTLHVIEAARKAMLGLSIDEIFNNILTINSYQHITQHSSELNNKPIRKKIAIVTACLTGEGGSLAIKSFLNSNLKYDKDLFEILCLNCLDKNHFKKELLSIIEQKEILFLVSSFPVDLNIKQYNMHDVLSMNVIDEIQQLVDTKSIILKLSLILKENIDNIDGKQLYDDIYRFVKRVEFKLKLKVDDEVFIGLVLHIAFAISRLKKGSHSAEYPDKEDFIKDNMKVYSVIKENFVYLYNKYLVDFSDNELCYITNFFLNSPAS